MYKTTSVVSSKMQKNSLQESPTAVCNGNNITRDKIVKILLIMLKTLIKSVTNGGVSNKNIKP